MRASIAMGLLSIALTIAGCERYAEIVTCPMGRVLDADDRCVEPAAPDAGASIDTCAALCADVPTWSEARWSCAEDELATQVPESCRDARTEERCLACIEELGATDASCAAIALACP